jgi:DNA-binding transcriptional ArsR family regulator
MVPCIATFAALGDTTRLEIVDRLSHGPLTVSELAAPLDMSLRGVLKHVQVLEDAGVVRTAKSGRSRQCVLQRERLDEAAAWVDDVRHRWTRRLDRMERLLNETEDRP